MTDSIVNVELIAELVAIDIWDEMFKQYESFEDFERVAYLARQVRRQEIHRQILKYLCRQERFPCFQEFSAKYQN